ncbi:MAG TPA: DUF4148 domain-containing protein, partial [Burkholderiaceae bacterium]|nr:DUF4148 domain-containing protein [Burkholderiaceae bacterium]
MNIEAERLRDVFAATHLMPSMSRTRMPRLTEAGRGGQQAIAALPGIVRSLFTSSKGLIMNSKLVLTAISLSVASGLSMAGEVNQPLTRAQVVSQLNQAIATGTLLRSDADFAQAPIPRGSTLTRAQVAAEVAAARANGTLLISDADFALKT